MNILTLDSSGKIITAGIVIIERGKIEFIDFINNLNEKSKQIEISYILNKLLKTNNKYFEKIDLIATTVGPGSFSGIRASIALSLGLSLALNIHKEGINSMDKLHFLSLKNKKYNDTLNMGLLTLCDTKRNTLFARISDFKSDKIKASKIKILSIENLVKIKKLSKFKKILITGDCSEEASVFLNKKGFDAESILDQKTIYGKEASIAMAELALMQRKTKTNKNFRPEYLSDPLVGF